MAIPKIIFQTWKDKNLPEHLLTITQTWKNLNPDYEYRFYDDNDCLNFIKNNYPEYLEVYASFPKPVEKADFFRYLVIYHFGGVYADLDTSCEKTLDMLITPEDEIIIGLEADVSEEYAKKHHWAKRKYYVQWTFMAKPKHPLILDAVRLCASNSNKDLPTIEKTGPGMWTEVVLKYQNWHGVKLLSVDYFGAGPHHSNAKFANPDKIFVLHYFFTSWKPGKERDQFDYYYHKEKVMNRIKYARGEIGGLKYFIRKQLLNHYKKKFKAL